MEKNIVVCGGILLCEVEYCRQRENSWAACSHFFSAIAAHTVASSAGPKCAQNVRGVGFCSRGCKIALSWLSSNPNPPHPLLCVCTKLNCTTSNLRQNIQQFSPPLQEWTPPTKKEKKKFSIVLPRYLIEDHNFAFMQFFASLSPTQLCIVFSCPEQLNRWPCH